MPLKRVQSNTNYITKINSPVGMLTVASDGKNITGLWIEGQKYFPSNIENYVSKQNLPVFQEVKKWLDCYFKGNVPNFKLPIITNGSDFRQLVWHQLQKIPYGKTISYGEIAEIVEKETGKRQSARAVGGAVGHNPISIIIPCHRVIGSTGKLTGYAGGLDVKIKLLQIEGIIDSGK